MSTDTQDFPDFPQAFHVSGSSLEPCVESWEEIQQDPRGLVLLWHPPDPKATYVMGGDPTVGITGWTRAHRVEGDHKTDNGALEIFEPDAVSEPLWTIDPKTHERIPDIDPVTKRRRFLLRDLQVAEFAAPVDAVEFARIANVLGRIYSGQEEACEFIFESYPGPGMLSTQELLRLAYPNLWLWETFADSAAEQTNSIGWHSTPRSQKILWYRARRHLMERKAILRSKFLIEEYSDAEIDIEKMRAQAAYGRHDDRFMAANLCFWAGHRWTYDEPREEPVTETPVLDYQRLAPTLDDGHVSFGEWKKHALDWW